MEPSTAGDGSIAIPADEPVTDDELTALALAADVEGAVPSDAVCLWELTGTDGTAPLPAWYMPAPMGTPRFDGWRRHLVR